MEQEINMVSIPLDEYYNLINSNIRYTMLLNALKNQAYVFGNDDIFFMDAQLVTIIRVICPNLAHHFDILVNAKREKLAAQAAEKEEEEHDI